MKKLSKLLLVLSFVFSVTSSAFAVTVASWGGAYTEITVASGAPTLYYYWSNHSGMGGQLNT